MSSRSFVRDADDTQRRSHWGGMRLAPRSKHGLTPRQQQTLATLAKNGGVIAETARELRVTPAAIYITLARIRASGIAVTVHGLSPQEVAAP
jgi:DNA-binding MarR family transcriptional regulator